MLNHDDDDNDIIKPIIVYHDEFYWKQDDLIVNDVYHLFRGDPSDQRQTQLATIMHNADGTWTCSVHDDLNTATIDCDSKRGAMIFTELAFVDDGKNSLFNVQDRPKFAGMPWEVNIDEHHNIIDVMLINKKGPIAHARAHVSHYIEWRCVVTGGRLDIGYVDFVSLPDVEDLESALASIEAAITEQLRKK